MPAGIDDISAVAGIISCTITLLYGCVKGFELLCRARKSETQMSSLRLMLEFEEQKLIAWAQAAGLFANPPNLRVAVHHANLVRDTLKTLCDLLNDGRKLKFYGLVAESTSEVMVEISDETALSRLDLAQRPEVQEILQASTHVFQSRTSPWHKLKWVAVDEQRFRRLLDDISRLTTHLQDLLESDKARMLQCRHSNLLRIAVISTKSQQDLELLGQENQPICMNTSVAATARLKKRSLRLGLLERLRQVRSGSMHEKVTTTHSTAPVRRSAIDIAAGTDPDMMKLSLRHLRLPSSPGPCDRRQIAYYDRRPVLIEWRAVDMEAWRLLKTRVSNLAGRLNAMDDASFHSLPCRGYLRYQDAGLYGYVFDLPTTAPPESSGAIWTDSQTAGLPKLPSMQTLRGILGMPMFKPSLDVRIACAVILFENILQLHTAGWLHKELRSENILFFGLGLDPGSQAGDLPQKMCIGGYVYARADTPYDFTEPAISDVESMIYRHPSSLGAIRLPYRKSFDIFSIGCILLELGLWSSLADILNNHVIEDNNWAHGETVDNEATMPASPPTTQIANVGGRDPRSKPGPLQLMRTLLKQLESPREIKSAIIEHLKGETGKMYAEMVAECLTLETRTAVQAVDIGMQEQFKALDLEERLLTQLRRLAEVL